MTVSGYIEEKIEIPKDVKASLDNGIVTLKGKNGQLSRNFSHPKVKLAIADNHVDRRAARCRRCARRPSSVPTQLTSGT